MLDRLLNRFNPMSLLLMKDGYPPAVVVALLLHGALLFFLLDRKLVPSDSVDPQQPAYVSAVTIDQNPQRMRRIEQEQARAREREQARREEQRQQEREQEEQAAREAEQRRQAEAEAEQQRQEEAERQRREEQAEQQRREEAEQRAREEEAAREQARREQEAREQQAREQAAREAEAARQQAAEQAAADNQAIQAYTSIIHETVSRNWSIPPSARNGMTVLLNIRLVPTGEVISVDVLESSGDPAFDRSAEQAVLKAERFPELQQMPTRLFEREFRSINLVFRPEDLLR